MARRPRRSSGHPTDAELEILQVLWDRGPSTVREVHEALGGESANTTVLKFMQIMTEKGLLRRDSTQRPQRFEPISSRADTQRKILDGVMERVFRGSPGNLVLQALSTKGASAEERRRIRELLDRLESEEG